MFIYFSIYCFLGYLLESTYISILKRKVVSSGLLKGPYIPLYGVGACLLAILSLLVKSSYLLCFFIGGLTMTFLELFTSYYIEYVFHTKCWDYSKHYLNYQGRICLLYFIIWCLLSLLFIQWIHPWIMKITMHTQLLFFISLIYYTFMIKDLIDRLVIQTKGLEI